MDGPAGPARNLQGFSSDVAEATLVQLVAVNHGDPELCGTLPIRAGVGEVCDSDLHDATRVEPRGNETANGGAVAAAVPQVVVRVEGDEAGRGEVVAGDPEGGGNGEGVVAAHGDHECGVRRQLGDPRGGCDLTGLRIRICDIAGVHDAQRLVEDELRLRSAQLACAGGDHVA